MKGELVINNPDPNLPFCGICDKPVEGVLFEDGVLTVNCHGAVENVLMPDGISPTGSDRKLLGFVSSLAFFIASPIM